VAKRFDGSRRYLACLGHIVLDGDPAPLPKGAQPCHNFRPISVVAKWMYGSRCHPLDREVGLGPSDTVFNRDPVPPSPDKGAEPPIFGLCPYCGQTAGWIKMSLGVEVGLGPGHIVLDGTQLPPQKAAQPPIFGPCLLRQNVWMDQDTTWCGGRPRPRPHCVRWGLSSPS